MISKLHAGALAATWAGVAVVVVGFFMPWVSIAVGAGMDGRPLAQLAADVADRLGGRVVVNVQRGAETVSGSLEELAAIPPQLSGAEIPDLARREDTRLALAVAELLTGRREFAQRSNRVYAVPAFAVLLALAAWIAGRRGVLLAVIGLAALSLAGYGFWRLATAKTHVPLLSVGIGPGLWLSCCGYLIVGAAAVLAAVQTSRKAA